MIRETKHLLEDAFSLENERIRIQVLPRLGGKIASFVYKPKGYELLFQPATGKYGYPSFGADFSLYDTSGMDECLPTIDACPYPGKDILLPDHGEIWSSAMETMSRDPLVLGMDMRSLPCRYEKRYFLEKDALCMEYSLRNTGDEKVYYLWALHGLFTFDSEARLHFPESHPEVLAVDNVLPGKFLELSSYKKGQTYKFYFQGEVKEGYAALAYSNGLVLEYLYDPKDLPYLGVWITTGGYKGELNIAIEPCNGYYDSLKRAVELGKAACLEKDEEKTWRIRLRLKEERRGR